MKQTAVEYLVKEFSNILGKIQTETLQDSIFLINAIEQAKEMEKQDIDNKVIHFAEWLTKKHTLELMVLYEQFKKE